MVFHGCACGTVVTWEDERQPHRRDWRHLVKLLRKSGANVVIFNGNKPLKENFSGRN
jgi:hypothetical protein